MNNEMANKIDALKIEFPLIWAAALDENDGDAKAALEMLSRVVNAAATTR
jgi:hypothetical protein